jgi:hypothetical protein
LIQLKSRGEADYWDFDICRIKDCYGPAEKLYSDGENSLVDVCSEHYFRLMKERDNG